MPMLVGPYSSHLNGNALAGHIADLDMFQQYQVTFYQRPKPLATTADNIAMFNEAAARGIQLGWTGPNFDAWADTATIDAKVQALQWLGDYSASNPGKFHNIYLGHEVLERWNRAKRREVRQKMFTLANIPFAKQHMYFGSLRGWNARGDDSHSMGGTWADYLLGGDQEPGILSFGHTNNDAVLEAEISALRQAVRAIDAPIYTHVNVPVNYEQVNPGLFIRDRVRSLLRLCDRFGVDICLVRVTNAAGIAPAGKPWPVGVFEGIRDYR